MLAIFPELLPEEPLYSVVARYGEMMDLPGDSVLARHVFGIATVYPAVDLRISLEADHPFRSKPITHFGRRRSPISLEADHSFRSKLISHLD